MHLLLAQTGSGKTYTMEGVEGNPGVCVCEREREREREKEREKER